uniref:Uncharacterized protein n=1 Tax=viral metagenome TaxID=1070528 RepID=A0A6C0IZZ1_9ZZZZ
MNIISYLYYITKNLMWKNYFTHKSFSNKILLSIDYISSSYISEENHITLKNSIDFFEDDTNIGKSIIYDCCKIFKKIINYDKNIIIKKSDNNKAIYFIVNNILYQYFIKSYENDILSGRLYRINIYNNEKLDYLYISNNIRYLVLKDKKYIKYIISN